jgi:hypothetical protein
MIVPLECTFSSLFFNRYGTFFSLKEDRRMEMIFQIVLVWVSGKKGVQMPTKNFFIITVVHPTTTTH